MHDWITPNILSVLSNYREGLYFSKQGKGAVYQNAVNYLNAEMAFGELNGN